jgi:RimJ/RimL family protein N-acetyltransferase/predicted GNAT family N-acyltransferase
MQRMQRRRRRTFLPFTTPRLVLRPLTPSDVTALTSYRNDPDVARYQDWELPYTRDLAHQLVDEMAGIQGPAPGAWVQIAIADASDRLIGDLAVGLDPDGRLATIGYTLGPEHQGKGLATEAAGALVDRLFERSGVHRVAATLDPANVASARVLERLGFRYEGRSVSSAFVRGEWFDDDRYAILADERRAWSVRRVAPPATVRLVEITPSNARAVGSLRVHRSQERLVAPVLVSFADALFPEPDDGGGTVVPWYRAIEADGELVGFVMLSEATATSPEPYLWRLLVDRQHQGRGNGRRVIEDLAARQRAEGHEHLAVSWVPGRGSPEPFYLGLGFVPTGEVHDGEIVARLAL